MFRAQVRFGVAWPIQAMMENPEKGQFAVSDGVSIRSALSMKKALEFVHWLDQQSVKHVTNALHFVELEILIGWKEGTWTETTRTRPREPFSRSRIGGFVDMILEVRPL